MNSAEGLASGAVFAMFLEFSTGELTRIRNFTIVRERVSDGASKKNPWAELSRPSSLGMERVAIAVSNFANRGPPLHAAELLCHGGH
jgi:hypothetical protein